MQEAEQILQVVILPGEEGLFGADVIQTRVELSNLSTIQLVIDILLKSCFDDQGPRCVEQVVKGNVVVIEYSLATESIVESKEYMRKGKDEILVEKVENQLGIS